MTASRHQRLPRTGGHLPRDAPVSTCAPAAPGLVERRHSRCRISRKGDCSQAVNVPLNSIATSST
jgi:hypothetical protein